MNFSQRNQIFFHFLDFFFQSHWTFIEIAKNTKQQYRCIIVFKSRNKATQILLTVAADVITLKNVKKSMRIVANLLFCKNRSKNNVKHWQLNKHSGDVVSRILWLLKKKKRVALFKKGFKIITLFDLIKLANVKNVMTAVLFQKSSLTWQSFSYYFLFFQWCWGSLFSKKNADLETYRPHFDQRFDSFYLQNNEFNSDKHIEFPWGDIAR